MSQLRRWAEREKILPLCVGINRLENTDDWVFRIAMGEFFDYDIDIARVIKWRGIYENAESPTARCEDVANIIEGVALKHA